ncbi:hypothetical protein [Acinetobacter colistiniresistens]|uniref:hypothetical protein n=1 Tax=Acinetobacter colistiniresistens TaxID=280145 RepID=UPI00125000F4|nr:hypothetical protein [Acinetobacter colistiniresistens]
MKKLISLALLCAVAHTSFAKDPQFKEYPATVYNGKPAKLLLNNETAKLFKTRLTAALSQKPVYAGEYVLAAWGCGTECVSYTFVNKRTGQVVDQGFGGEMGDEIQNYKLNSNLLIARGSELDDDYNEIGSSTNYYVMKNGKLQLIKKVPNK